LKTANNVGETTSKNIIYCQ